MRLLVVPSSPNDTTSLYRSLGPLAELRRSVMHSGIIDAPNFEAVQVREVKEFTWSTICEFDAVFMQRPFKPLHVTCAELARAMGRPLWLDYDDDLFSVPLDNPAHRLYESEGARRNVAKLASMADVITVSTPALKRRFDALNGDVRVAPNAWNEEIFGELTDKPGHLPNIMWRGSHTHQQDVLDYALEITEVAEAFPAWSWTFIGWTPYMCVRYMRPQTVNIVHHLDPIDYFRFIRKIYPSICIVPLVRNEFNDAKSNIAWIEATSAGAVTLAPDMAEWRRPGVVTYDSQQQFKDRLTKLIDVGPEGRAKLWNVSRKHILEHLTLAKVNEVRRRVIGDLNVMANNPVWREHAIRGRGVAVETGRAGPVASRALVEGDRARSLADAGGHAGADQVVADADPRNG